MIPESARRYTEDERILTDQKKSEENQKNLKYCPNCGSITDGKIPGSLWITLFLLLLWVLPGIVYEIWRTQKSQLRCAKCNLSGLIPIDSVVAKKALKDNSTT